MTVRTADSFKLQGVEHIVLATVNGEVCVTRCGPDQLIPRRDHHRFTGWDSVRGPRRFPSAKPSGPGVR